MIDNLADAISHAREVAEYFTMKSNELYERQYEASLSCSECAKDNKQIAEWLTELQERREAVKKLEEAVDNYKDSLFGDGIRFALKVIGEPRKRD